MSVAPSGSAVRALALEYKSLQEEPVEGFRVKLLGEDNLFEWEVAIFGPPDTLYQGGYFKAHMKFPQDYPYSPPSIRFLTKVWHPNVYELTGSVGGSRARRRHSFLFSSRRCALSTRGTPKGYHHRVTNPPPASDVSSSIIIIIVWSPDAEDDGLGIFVRLCIDPSVGRLGFDA